MFKRKRHAQKKKEINFECPTCGKTFARKYNFDMHTKNHLSKEGLNEEKVRAFHYCEKCGEKFKSIESFRHHVKTQHSEGPFPCPDCGLEFAKYNSRKHHQLKEHKPQLQCDLCDYKAYWPACLKQHKKRHFDPTFKCCYCEKLFKKKSSLEAHEREHRGEKPFACTVCGTSFSGKGYLRQHVRGAHGMKLNGGKALSTGWGHKKKNADLPKEKTT